MRLLFIFMLGLSSGLPLALSGTLLQAWLTVEGVDLIHIGLLALVGLPYIFKFLWAPLLDRFNLFGYWRRSWIWFFQGLLVVLLLLMGLTSSSSLLNIGLLALGIALTSASLDIVIDAYRTEILLEADRGLGASLAMAGYRISMLISGGLGLWLADRYGFSNTYFIMAVCMSGLLCYSLKLPALPTPLHNTEAGLSWLKILSSYFEPCRELCSREHFAAILALLMLYKLGDACAASLSTTFLIRELQLSLAWIGLSTKVMGLTGTLMGAFYGGYLLKKWTLWRALWVFGVLQSLTNIGYVLISVLPSSVYIVSALLWLENFTGGMGTTAFMTFLMSLCIHPQWTAAQYALLSAAASLGRVVVAPFSAYAVEAWGWNAFYWMTVLIGLMGLTPLFFLKHAQYSSERKAANEVAGTL